MKIFLSWSGHKSQQIAIAFRDWLPYVINSVTPYVSSEDIDKGSRWSTDIAKELEDSSFGILCVTKENYEAPWLIFEAGALSKMVDKSFVCPFLYDLKRADLSGPLLAFQSTINEQEDIRKLVHSINKSLGESSLKEEHLNKAFEVWWPQLEVVLNSISNVTIKEKEDTTANKKIEILEEILELTRVNQKLLRSPSDLLPQDYIKNILTNIMASSGVSRRNKELEYTIALFNYNFQVSFLKLRATLNSYLNGNRVVDSEVIERAEEVSKIAMKYFTRDLIFAGYSEKPISVIENYGFEVE